GATIEQAQCAQSERRLAGLCDGHQRLCVDREDAKGVEAIWGQTSLKSATAQGVRLVTAHDGIALVIAVKASVEPFHRIEKVATRLFGDENAIEIARPGCPQLSGAGRIERGLANDLGAVRRPEGAKHARGITDGARSCAP